MAFYPQFPAIYAYPMPFPNQEFYAMYPPGQAPGGGQGEPGGGSVYYEAHTHHHSKSTNSHPPNAKHGFNNRKDSADSGISDFSVLSSRKTSSTSTISNASVMQDDMASSHLDDVKEEPPFEEPDDELCEKIVQQVEFYFSDANITKDKFLLKHVKRNKEGFVSLKLISSFKRVKHLTKDWRQVADAIERKSDKLEVNDLKTKVRRLEALPEYDETTPSRTVVALNLPLERPTIEAVAEIFSVCGDIVLIRILRPGNPVPADIKPFVNKHPEMVAKVCALVEFERTEFALKAVRELNDIEDEDKMKVMELTAPPAKKKSNEDKKKAAVKAQMLQAPQRRFSHAGFAIPHQHTANAAAADSLVLGPRRRISLYHNMKFSPIEEEQKAKQAEAAGGLNPNAPTFQMQQRRISRPPFLHPAAAMEAAAAHAAAAQAAHQAAQTMQMQMQQHPHHWINPRRISGLDMAVSGLSCPPNVLRMPRGPDKGKGFQKWCKNRMEPAPVKKSHAVPIVAPPEAEDQEEAAAAKVPEIQVSAASDEEGGGAVAVAPPVPEVAAAVADVSSNGSDSGHEDDSFSEHEADPDNERSR